MKAFLAALVALVVISIGADLALKRAGFSSEQVFAGANVRLGGPAGGTSETTGPSSY